MASNNFSTSNEVLKLEKHILNENWNMVLKLAYVTDNTKYTNIAIKNGADNWNMVLCEACQGNNIDLIKSIVKKGANNFNKGLKWACFGGNQNVIDFMIESGACEQISSLAPQRGALANNWDKGLEGACLGGNLEILKLMISKGANKWNEGLYEACRGGHKDIAELMMKNGANDFNYGLVGACRGGNEIMIELMIKKGGNNWAWGLDKACRGGHKDIALLMIMKLTGISKGPGLYGKCKEISKEKDIIEWIMKGNGGITNPTGFGGTCQGGHYNLFELMSHVAPVDWNSGLFGACYGGNLHLVKRMIKGGADDDHLHGAFLRACKGGHLYIVEFMMKEIKQRFRGTARLYNNGFVMAHAFGNYTIAKSMIENGADFDCIINNEAFLDTSMIEFMIKHGVNNWDNGLRLALSYFRRYLDIAKLIIEKGSPKLETLQKELEKLKNSYTHNDEVIFLKYLEGKINNY